MVASAGTDAFRDRAIIAVFMLFNSLEFLVFFVAVTLTYWTLPWQWRWLLLLVASCVFYMAFIPAYIAILGLTIAVDYLAGLLIERSTGAWRRSWLLASIVANVGVLVVFKYLGFLTTNALALCEWLGGSCPVGVWNIVLPIGLSFHTFQAMSYTIEVYRGRQPAERHLGRYALYVMFYPQLVAGPIERPQNLLPQFRVPAVFDARAVADGLKLMAIGFFKKTVVADRLGAIVDAVYAKPHDQSGVSLLIATVLFAFQIYADFAGYSDIALGAAQVMGVRLMRNFRRPYFSLTTDEFWHRWHISLSTWFRDYVYIPMGGGRTRPGRRVINVLVTFAISGIWHGANWTFLMWGTLNGLYVVVGHWTRDARRRLKDRVGLSPNSTTDAAIGCVATFALITVAWVFFRAGSVSDAAAILQRMITDLGSVTDPDAWLGVRGLHVDRGQFLAAGAAAASLLGLDWLDRRGPIHESIGSLAAWQRWAVYYAFSFVIVFCGRFGAQQFIYFQF